MESFAFSFLITMMHSIWQSALLLCMYAVVISASPHSSPLYKRNILFSITGMQIFISLITFIIIYTNQIQTFLLEYSISIHSILQDSWVQKNATLLFLVYSLVIAFRFLRSVFLWQKFKLDYQKTLLKPSIDLRLFTQSKAFHFGIKPKVMLWYSSKISTPMTFGFWKPIILLPIALINQLTIKETEALIIHELSHISNHDYLLNWLLMITKTIYFFNPFIHILSNKIKIEREKNCDVQVLQFNYGDILYAETLLKTAQYQQLQLNMQIAAVQHKKQLLNRIQFFSTKENINFKNNPTFLSITILAIAILLNLMTAFTFIKSVSIDKGSMVLSPNQDSKNFKVVNNELIQNVLIDLKNAGIKKPVQNKTGYTKPINKETSSEYTEANNYNSMQVASSEMNVEGKEIILQDIGTDGKKITAVYYALLIDGVWTLQPLWMIKESISPINNSSGVIKDSLIKIFPTIQ